MNHDKEDHSASGSSFIPHPSSFQGAEPLLTQVLQNGQLLQPLPSLAESRERCRQQLSHLPEELLDLDHHHTYSVRISPELEQAERDS